MTEAPLGTESPVVHTLENLIAPGMRARLSPYVEAAQLSALFGRAPDQQRREASTNVILEQEQLRIGQLAQHWASFAAGQKDFAGNDYREADFLDAYLAYYFSVNVAKVQLVLLDLVRAGEIRGQLRLLDIGVGTGTTAVALLDFLLAWSQVCDLYGEPFPVDSVELLGIDRSEAALEWGRRVVAGYAEALDRNTGGAGGLNRQQTFGAWGRAARWERHDLGTAALPDLSGYSPTLVFASNVWNELDAKGRRVIEGILAGLLPGASAVFIEPGTRKCACELMKWRRRFLEVSEDMVSLGPCGQEFGAQLPLVCDTCWHVRREAFQQTALYTNFRTACSALVVDQRSFDDFENHLLSWSYVMLGKRASAQKAVQSQAVHSDGKVSAPVSVTARYIGSYYGHAANPVDYDPDGFSGSGRNKAAEFAKLCPATFGLEKIAFVREPGFQMPRLRHGEEIRIENVVLGDYKGAPCLVPPEGRDWSEVQVLPVAGGRGSGFIPAYNETARAAVDKLAHRLFGFARMRDFQHDILSRVLTGRNILGIAATGGGKSECFILPAVLFSGITVVVSPLKSLMHDQYYQRIRDRYGLHHLTTFINGDVPFYEREARLKRMEQGCYRLVYFTPEQLERSYVLESLQRADAAVGVRYLAMDEAHCISQWGHDFRPSYLNILHRLQRRELQPRIIALTATASPPVRSDICDELGLDARPWDQGGDVLVHSANRPELSLVVRVTRDTAAKAAGIVQDLRQLERYNKDNDYPGAALLFMPYTGGDPDRVTGGSGGAQSTGVSPFASYLELELGRKVAIYHGKMDSDDAEPDDGDLEYSIEAAGLGDMRGRSRESQQEAFILGSRDVMVATKGFGMGVDKPNIRYVIHRSPTTNLEAYAQEVGRAGRDGEIATAILYYSPDSPRDELRTWAPASPSDNDIQQRFLAGKYVRVQDIAALWSFIRQVKRRLTVSAGEGERMAVYMYFTNDEILEHLDGMVGKQLAGGHVFAWPDFPPRERYEDAWGEHKAILDRGHLYSQKTDYVRRILAAAYRIRPEVTGHSRLGMVESVQPTGASVKEPQLRDWPRIVASNAHFGRAIRLSAITQEEFAQALEQADLLSLAERLGMPLRELTAMLSDIRFCSGRRYGDRWTGDLLEFKGPIAPKYGPASGRNTLAQWRDYAGARGRANKTRAIESARRHHRDEPALDDYFGWDELCRSVGWEVQLNAEFPADRLEEYLSSFATAMADRQRVDLDSYRRLLTGYIGVQSDGQVGNWTKPSNCLRAVMLGYLKSHEVIDGGNCRSCNGCLPESDLDKYTVEQRREVVVRMSARAEELFEKVEQASAAFPDGEAIPALLAEVEAERERGRSLDRYFEGWSARLLEDEPEHRAGILARMQAAKAGLVPVDGTELGSLAGRLRRLLTPEAAPVIWEAVTDLDDLAPSEVEVYLVQSAVKRIADDARGEVAVIRGLLAAEQAGTVSPSALQMSEVWLRLRELCAPDGVLPDTGLFRGATIYLARASDDWQISRALYAEAFGPGLHDAQGWTKIDAELDTPGVAAGQISAAPILGLLSIWSDAGGGRSNQEQTRDVAGWLESHDGLLETLGSSAGAAQLAATLDPAGFVDRANAAVWATRSALVSEGATAQSAAAGARLAVMTLAAGVSIDQETARQLVRWVSQAKEVDEAFETSLLDEQLGEEQRSSVLDAVLAEPEYASWTILGRWLELVESSRSFSTRPDVVLDFVVAADKLCLAHPRGAEACLADQARSANLERLQTLVVSSLREHEKSRDAHQELVSLLAAFPPSLAEYVEMCLLEEGVPDEVAQDGFARLVSSGDRHSVLALLRSARSRPNVVLPRIMQKALRLFEALHDLFNTAGGRALDRPEPSDIGVLWSSLTPEASVEDADLFVAGIHELRKEWNPAWMTPVAQEVDALVMARRYREAEELAGKHPGLVLGIDRRLAAEWIAQARAWGEPRSAPPDATVLSRVASYTLEDLKARQTAKTTGSATKSTGRLKRAGRSIAKWMSGGG